jgi:hypothetical protein
MPIQLNSCELWMTNLTRPFRLYIDALYFNELEQLGFIETKTHFNFVWKFLKKVKEKIC